MGWCFDLCNLYYSNVKDAQVTRINDSLTYLHSIIHKQYLSLSKKKKKKIIYRLLF